MPGMEREDDLITLVIHTEEHALKLKEILEFHKIPVTLEDIVCAELPLQIPPKKIRIPLSYLPLGLKVLESGENTTSPLALVKMTGMGNTLLIPVDFSTMSMLAVKVGFFLAEKFGVEPVVLHSFISASIIDQEDFSDNPDFITLASPTGVIEPEEAIVNDRLRRQASQDLLKFKKIIIEEQRAGTLPDIKFSTSLLEGIPEQVIQEYCKDNKPATVVMATRGTHKKGKDLIGSVTAEVIDSCRVPVVTVPENYVPASFLKSKHVAVFCTFTGFDTLVIRWLMKSFDYPDAKFYLIPAGDRPVSRSAQKLEELRSYLSKTYPTAEFYVRGDLGGKFDDRVKSLVEDNKIELMIVPNKKSSAFSRFFKPTLAHKILFEKDIPLLVIPV